MKEVKNKRNQRELNEVGYFYAFCLIKSALRQITCLNVSRPKGFVEHLLLSATHFVSWMNEYVSVVSAVT